MGAVVGNWLWGSLKYRIRDFVIKYGHKLWRDKAKKPKALEIRLFGTVKRGDSQAIDLVRRGFEIEASVRYKGFIVRSMLKIFPKEAVKFNSYVREEEARRFPHRYIESIKSPNEHALQSSREIQEIIRVHFRDCFACLPDLPLQEFCRYLTDFPTIRRR